MVPSNMDQEKGCYNSEYILKKSVISPTWIFQSSRTKGSCGDDHTIDLTIKPIETPEQVSKEMNVLEQKYEKYLNLSRVN